MIDGKRIFMIDLMNEKEVKKHIKLCEGQHTQQVSYSTYHNAFTQVCFDCKRIRTNMVLQNFKYKEN